jgi:hypothetical protein
MAERAWVDTRAFIVGALLWVILLIGVPEIPPSDAAALFILDMMIALLVTIGSKLDV